MHCMTLQRLAAVAFLCAAFAWTPRAHADDASHCQTPAWAPTPMPGFKIDGCEHKAWDSTELDLPTGSTPVSGERWSVNYTLANEGDGPAALPVRDYFIAAAKRAGASLVSDPGATFNAILKRHTPAGTFWYEYDHGSGSDTSTSSYTLTTWESKPLAQAVVAQPMQAALPEPGSACGNPPWLVKQFAYFKADSCDAKAWDQVTYDLSGGRKTVEGRRLTVNYVLTDQARDPAALLVQKNYVAALQKIGAKLMSDPADEYKATLMQKTAAGEFWYHYEHTSGSSTSTGSYALTTLQVLPFPQVVVAQVPKGALLDDMQGKGCKTPPWVLKQFDYYKLSDCTRDDLDSITLDLPAGKKTLAGRYLELNYRLTDEKRDASALYVKQNYVNALQKIGARLVSAPDDVYHAVLTQKVPQGEFWYIYTHTGGSADSTTAYSLAALQVGGPPSKACKLQVYGIRFDFNKADIKPESEPVLEQVLALFKADPAYQAEIGGHTDNVGGSAYNLKLSAQRASAVKAWLVAHGVAAGRISSQGYGLTQPLVPNDTDAHRAKNRRVELQRKDCRN